MKLSSIQPAGVLSGGKALLHGNSCPQAFDDNFKFTRFNNRVVVRTEESEVTDWNFESDRPAFTGVQLDTGEGTQAFYGRGDRGKEIAHVEVYRFNSPACTGVGDVDGKSKALVLLEGARGDLELVVCEGGEAESMSKGVERIEPRGVFVRSDRVAVLMIVGKKTIWGTRIGEGKAARGVQLAGEQFVESSSSLRPRLSGIDYGMTETCYLRDKARTVF